MQVRSQKFQRLALAIATLVVGFLPLEGTANFCRVYYNQIAELGPEDAATFRKQIGAIMDRYPSFDAITMADNAAFITMKEETDEFYRLLEGMTDAQANTKAFQIEMLEREAKIGRLFLDAENAILKELNDVVFPDNKGFVTILLNAYKQMLWDRIQEETLSDGTRLADFLVGKYADAKNIRFAFNRDDPLAIEAVERVYLAAGQDLLNLVYAPDSMIAQRFLGATGIARDPASINLGGIDVFDVDFASTAARQARGNFDSGRIDRDLDQLAAARRDGQAQDVPERIGGTDPVHFPQVKAQLDAAARKAELTRLRMQMRFARKYPKLMDEYVVNDSVDIPSQELFEIMLKTKIPKGQRASKLNFLMALQREIRERFGYQLDLDELEMIYDYKNAVDTFSPGNYITHREPVDYRDFEHGMLLIDMTGQNVRNFRQTAIAVSEVTWNNRQTPQRFDARPIIQRARQGERIATEELRKRQKYIYDLMDKHFDCKKLPISGDDGACVPAKPITRQQRINFLNEISQHPEYSGNFRLSFVEPEFVDPNTRKPIGRALDSFAYEEFSGIAEAVEKEVPIRVIDWPGAPPRTVYQARGHANLFMGGFAHLPDGTMGRVYSMIREVFADISRANGLDPVFVTRLTPGDLPIPPTSVRNYGIVPRDPPPGVPRFPEGLRIAPTR